MFVLVILPLLTLVSVLGIFSLKFDDLDRIVTNFAPYAESGR